jgi:DNA invertase Pin-like site-specific DNA recombinase
MLIGYSRKSTLDQSHNLQTDALTQAGCQTIYQETMSGAKRHRPELEAALKSLRPGDTLTVWKLDRLGRSLKNLVDIINDLEERNIGFKSLTESIDTQTNTGKLVFNIFASLAEFERNLIRERTTAGLEAARARGRQGGRPSKLSMNQIKKANAMLMDTNITKTEVAKHFNVSRVTLNKALLAI